MDLAVCGTKISKSYGGGKVKAVRGLDINVPQRTVYGLLGPSGCGKTTLLRCILGRITPESGTIMVFGCAPGSAKISIPGSGVGYVPQELALYPDFSTREHLRYFGLLHGMHKNEVKQKTEFFVNLLDLPDPNRLVKNISGGQARRVSLAIGLLHEPPLLILDEPTVGLDPLLRVKIWEHLQGILAQSNTTIIVTTHYIEEAMRANLVGMMRDGRIMAEAPPDFLVKKYSMNTLEDVFLKLCRDIEGNPYSKTATDPAMRRISSFSSSSKVDLSERTPLLMPEGNSEAAETFPNAATAHQRKFLKTSFSNIGALMWKDLTKMTRNSGQVSFAFFLPALAIIIYCLAIGTNPSHLSLATVNLDKGHGPSQTNLGEVFLNCIANDTIKKDNYSSVSEARSRAHSGHVRGFVVIPPNFSVDTSLRILNCLNVSDGVINGSTVGISLDISNLQLVPTIQNALDHAVNCFINQIANLSSRHLNSDNLRPSINIGKPFYGKREETYSDYIIPGSFIIILFGLQITMTTLTFVVERKEGLLDRTWVAGVTATELLLSHMFANVIIIVGQIFIVTFVALVAFDNECKGSLALVLLFLLLQALAGSSIGLLISAYSDHEDTSINLAVGVYYPTTLISGILWPVEAIPKWLRTISYMMPTTKAVEAVRSIMQKGWGMDKQVVWEGYLITIAWIVGLITLVVIGLRVRR